jgi:hypothetical protein
MRVALVGAELEENMGLRYMASSLEHRGHEVAIVPFNTRSEIPTAGQEIGRIGPQIVGLSMVFTNRAREFCDLAQTLRDDGYDGHVIAGGHFAALNCQRLLQDFAAFDSVALGEGEEIICTLADNLDDVSRVAGLCFRRDGDGLGLNPSLGNPDNLDALPFPKRTTFHSYFGKPIASVLSSRGCWRNCAFCSINAWYKSGGGKKFRLRSVESIVAEMTELYHEYGIRIYNFQDDNFYLPDPDQALARFEALRSGLLANGVEGIAIAIKARPDTISYETVRVLDDLGLFRVFLGVENASQRGLRNLNRKCEFDQILHALQVLNDFDVHVAYNLLMFEPDTIMDDILINLRFMERHMENPANFCRAEAYAGTGLEAKLLAEGRLLGDYFGFDYRLKDPRCEAFHQIANYAFFDRNFSDFGLHYFNMQVDFFYQLVRRFHPDLLSQTLRGAVRSFIKRTNLDTYECLCQIYDFVVGCEPGDQVMIRGIAKEMRQEVDARSAAMHAQGERLIDWMTGAYERKGQVRPRPVPMPVSASPGPAEPARRPGLVPYAGRESLKSKEFAVAQSESVDAAELFSVAPGAIPYDEFKRQMAEMEAEGR